MKSKLSRVTIIALFAFLSLPIVVAPIAGWPWWTWLFVAVPWALLVGPLTYAVGVLFVMRIWMSDEQWAVFVGQFNTGSDSGHDAG